MAHVSSILIVDDMPDNVSILKYFLSKAGYRVVIARNGEEGLRLAMEEVPDLILLDVMMPGLDGFQVCEILKNKPEICDIPVIFISALSEVEDKVKAFKLGAADYIPKPLNNEEVLARVSTHVRLRRQQMQLQDQNRQLEQYKEQLLQHSAKLEVLNAELQRLSHIDSLTQIPNRRHFDEYLRDIWQQAMKLRTPVGLLMADIDYFKPYNDNYGHHVGDDCLTRVAQSFREVSKRPADLAARYGGEEFAVILPNTDGPGTAEVGKRLCEAVRNLKIPHSASPVDNHVTVSIGGSSVIPHAKVPPEALIRIADRALYQAKGRGRNCSVFLPLDSASPARQGY